MAFLRAFAAFRQHHPEFPAGRLRDARFLHRTIARPSRLPEAGRLRRIPRLDPAQRSARTVAPKRGRSFTHPYSRDSDCPSWKPLRRGCPQPRSARSSPLSSIAGDLSALQFDPKNHGAMVEAMRLIATDESFAQSPRRGGPAACLRFSWRATAENTLSALLEAASI